MTKNSEGERPVDGGWVKLHRKLMDKAIWKTSTVEQRAILVTILMMASHCDNEWEWQGKRFTVKPGQFVTSSSKLAEAVGVSRQNIRTALLRFSKYDFLTTESTNTGLLVTVTNWEVYQGNGDEPNQPINQNLTSDQPTPNQRLTTIKKVKNVKNDKEVINYIVEYLNEKTGKNFKENTKATVSHINARLSEGFIPDDFKKVIDKKVADWQNDPKMADYLRPETLFGSKFEGYLNSAKNIVQQGQRPQPAMIRGEYV